MSCKKCMDYDTVIGFEEQGYKCCPYCGENIQIAMGMAWVNYVNKVLDESELESKKETVVIDGEELEYSRKPWTHKILPTKFDSDVCIDKEMRMIIEYLNREERDTYGKTTDS